MARPAGSTWHVEVAPLTLAGTLGCWNDQQSGWDGPGAPDYPSSPTALLRVDVLRAETERSQHEAVSAYSLMKSISREGGKAGQERRENPGSEQKLVSLPNAASGQHHVCRQANERYPHKNSTLGNKRMCLSRGIFFWVFPKSIHRRFRRDVRGEKAIKVMKRLEGLIMRRNETAAWPLYAFRGDKASIWQLFRVPDARRSWESQGGRKEE